MKKKRLTNSKKPFKGAIDRVIGEVQKKQGKYFISSRVDEIQNIRVQDIQKLNLKKHTLVGLKINTESGEIKIDKVFGKSQKIEVEKEAIVFKYNISDKFSRKVTKEAEKLSGELSSEDIVSRIDLRKKLFFTIDGDDARDFDDAVCINKVRNGYKLFVSIADVSAYVPHGSSIDREALKRANSVYLPGKVYPMLPETLSNNICSLVPKEDRLTKTVEINFYSDGSVNNYRIYNSVINSKARLTYSRVSDLLSGKAELRYEEKNIVRALNLMNELYKKLKRKRMDAGELDFDFPEPELVRDRNGKVINVKKSERSTAHGLIEEFMIAANNVVAGFILDNKVASIYRTHEDPDPASVYELRQDLDEMGYKMKAGKKISPQDVQKVMLETNKRPDGNVVNMLILKSLKKAEYSTKEIGHFGLALSRYTHFTSPIRRYADLIVHRITESLINNNGYKIDKWQLDEISSHCSKTERTSDEIERELLDLERAGLMGDKIGKVYEGKIISIMPFGMFVELNPIYVEGFVHKSDMRMIGNNGKRRWFVVGQKVKVKVKEADIARRRVRFSLV